MQNNKKVLKYCPNFYRIINYEYSEEDYISARLVSVYQEYIFGVDLSVQEDINEIENLDKTIGKYIDDYFFRKEMKVSLKEMQIKKDTNILKAIVSHIIKTYNRYEEDLQETFTYRAGSNNNKGAGK